MNCPYCQKEFHLIDRDIPEECRTQANYWEKKYLQATDELRRANKGIYKLRCRLHAYKERYGSKV